jgi:hypothetical protein
MATPDGLLPLDTALASRGSSSNGSSLGSSSGSNVVKSPAPPHLPGFDLFSSPSDRHQQPQSATAAPAFSIGTPLSDTTDDLQAMTPEGPGHSMASPAVQSGGDQDVAATSRLPVKVGEGAEDAAFELQIKCLDTGTTFNASVNQGQ